MFTLKYPHFSFGLAEQNTTPSPSKYVFVKLAGARAPSQAHAERTK